MISGQFSFLVIGAGRGGTSLFAALLDKHDRVETAFEAFAIGILMGETYQTKDSVNLAQNRSAAFIQACQDDAARFPDKYWGNKITTEQLYGLEDHNRFNPSAPLAIFDYFFNQALKDIKVLFILRDGRTCVRSKMARTGQTLEAACERWRYSVALYRFLQTRHTNNLCIKYEDLLRQPEYTLKKVCDFLCLPFRESMLGGTDNAKMPADYRYGYFDTNKLHLDDIPPGCGELIRTELEYCNY